MSVSAARPRQAIKEFSKVGKPIYITETGIADAKDALRAEWAESYFRAVSPIPYSPHMLQHSMDLRVPHHACSPAHR